MAKSIDEKWSRENTSRWGYPKAKRVWPSRKLLSIICRTVKQTKSTWTIISDVIVVIIQAKLAFARIDNFLDAPKLQSKNCRKRCFNNNLKDSISIKCADFSWEDNASKPTLRNINLDVIHGQNVAIYGEVGSGESTLLARF